MLHVAHGAREIDGLERQPPVHEVVARHEHPGYPEKKDLGGRDECVPWIEALEVRRVLRPAERREGPQPRGEPGVEHIGILLDCCSAAARALLGVFACRPLVRAFLASKDGYTMTPPELPRDVPIADVLHPVLECRVPTLRNDLECSAPILSQNRLGERVHFHEPLIGKSWLDDGVAAGAATHRVRMRLRLFWPAR